MKRLIVVLIAVFVLSIPAIAADTNEIFFVGDSILKQSFCRLVASMPIGYKLDSYLYGLSEAGTVNLSADGLTEWAKTVDACADGKNWQCMVTADSGVIVIYGLGMNDMLNIGDVALYSAISDYATTFITYLATIHTDFPSATIVWVTGYPWDKDGDRLGVECSAFFPDGYGALTEVEPSAACIAAGGNECYKISNGMYHKFLTIALASVPSYVKVIDTYHAIINDYADTDTFADRYLSDCVHPGNPPVSTYVNGRTYFWDYYVRPSLNTILGTASIATTGNVTFTGNVTLTR